MPKIGFGVIGCGGNIGQFHAKAITQVRGVRLIGVADSLVEKAAAMGKKYGVAAFGDYQDLLSLPELDAVCVCLPSGLHAKAAIVSAKAGKHVLCEKPLGITTRQVDRMIYAARQQKVLLGCVFQSRFSKAVRLARQAIARGRFGRLVLGKVSVDWHRKPEYYETGGWHGTKKLDGGGAMMNQAIHTIDLLQLFFGPVKSVFGQTARRLHEYIEMEDLAVATVLFANGALGSITATTASWPGQPARIEIHGTTGFAVIEDGRLAHWEFLKRWRVDDQIEVMIKQAQESIIGSAAADPTKSLNVEGHRLVIADFAKAIRQGRAPAINGPEGRKSVELIEATYESAQSGLVVSLPRHRL